MKKRKNIEFIVTNNECWECISHSTTPYGYPQIMINKKNFKLHRLIYEQCHGKIPKGMVIRHTCDNPKCINPDHLILGTHKDNVMDRVHRGRSAIGERNGRSKLTEQQVKKILLDNKHTNSELGKKFNVDPKTISNIRNHINWKHVKV